MTDEVKHDFFLAKKDFLTKQQCEEFVKFLDKQDSSVDFIKTIVDEVIAWNDATLKFNINPEQPTILNYTSYEAQVKSTATPDHAIHIGNVSHPTPAKWSVIVNLHDRDKVQGGELVFRKWAPTPYKDNFGIWKGDPKKPHVPQWINELGTIVIYPSMVEHGHLLVTSGTATRAKILVNGPQFV